MKYLIQTFGLMALLLAWPAGAQERAGGGSSANAQYQYVNVPTLGFWLTNAPDTNYNGPYSPKFPPYSITNGSPAAIIPVFDFTNGWNAAFHFTNDMGESYFLLTSNAGPNAIVANGGFIATDLYQLDSSNDWQDVDAQAVTMRFVYTNFGSHTLRTYLNNTTPRNTVRVSTNGNDATAAPGYGAFRSFAVAMLNCDQPYDVLLEPGIYDGSLPTSDGMTLRPRQSIFGSSSSITYSSGSDVAFDGTSNTVQDVYLINGAQVAQSAAVGCNFVRLSVVEYTGGSGDSFAINFMTNCTFKNCYILGYENAFQGAAYGTNIIQDCHIVGVSKGGVQVTVPFFSSICTVTTNGGMFRFLGDNSIEAYNVAGGSGTSACITCNETNCVYDVRYGTLHLVHDSAAIAINDGTKGSIVMLGSYFDNGTNMLCDGVPGHIGIVPVQTISTNIGNGVTSLKINIPVPFYDTNYTASVAFMTNAMAAVGVSYSNAPGNFIITLSGTGIGACPIRATVTHQ